MPVCVQADDISVEIAAIYYELMKKKRAVLFKCDD